MFTKDICEDSVYSVELSNTSNKKAYCFATKINGTPIGVTRAEIKWDAMDTGAIVRLTAAMTKKDGTPNLKNIKTLTLKFLEFRIKDSYMVFANAGHPTYAKVTKAKLK